MDVWWTSSGVCCILKVLFLYCSIGSWEISVSTVTSLLAGQSGVRIPAGATGLSFSKMSKPALGPTLPPIQFYRGSLSEVKRSGRDVDRSAPSSVEVKNEWSYASSSPYAVDKVNLPVQKVKISW